MGTKKDIRDLEANPNPTTTQTTVDVEVTGNAAVPATTTGGSAMQQVNPEFEGLDTIANFMPYFILDGSELLNKTNNQAYPNIEVVLEGGKPVWQIWDLNSNLVAESFDGVKTPEGRDLSEVLETTRAKESPSDAEKIKVQARYEIYFQWDYGEEGEKLTKISLSPASKFAFAAYVKELTKQGLTLAQVITRIGAERTVSKQGYRYSRATFEMVGEV